ncbi:hypothetical protein KC19_7G078700 [Ceratodon purpureus]|uniref:Uncharacterized protein n=1 Tax=Ceratodon purpureus TaxID=3225 RepID=A0A8T0HC14_CERPU|nr:hypothetical protein KC19_7G078700 [Ceratodon purpureus]
MMTSPIANEAFRGVQPTPARHLSTPAPTAENDHSTNSRSNPTRQTSQRSRLIFPESCFAWVQLSDLACADPPPMITTQPYLSSTPSFTQSHAPSKRKTTSSQSSPGHRSSQHGPHDVSHDEEPGPELVELRSMTTT